MSICDAIRLGMAAGIANAMFDNAFWNIDIFSDAKTVEDITLEEANAFLMDTFKKDRITFSVVEPYKE